jgi:hypothetical protein
MRGLKYLSAIVGIPLMRPKQTLVATGLRSAYGRDATDLALMSNFGPLELVNMKVWVNAAE